MMGHLFEAPLQKGVDLMRTDGRGWLVRGILPALLIGTGALAAGDNRNEVDLPVSKQANLSAQETLTQAKTYVGRMQEVLQHIVKLQEVAKKQKDIIKLNCVNDKLLQVRGHLAVADKAMSALNEAIARSDDAGRNHEYSRISILHQKATVIDTEANNCVGEEISVVGPPRVDVEIDPSIPIADVTDPGFPQLDYGRPPQASASL